MVNLDVFEKTITNLIGEIVAKNSQNEYIKNALNEIETEIRKLIWLYE